METHGPKDESADTPGAPGEDTDAAYDWTVEDADDSERAQVEMLKAKIEDTAGKLSNVGKIWLRNSLKKHLATPRSAEEKAKAKEMERHIRSGHRTKLVLNTKPCEGCIAGATRPKYATKNKGPYISKVNTINSDTVFFPGEKDNNGDICAWHGIELKTRVGGFTPATNKSSMQTANA